MQVSNEQQYFWLNENFKTKSVGMLILGKLYAYIVNKYVYNFSLKSTPFTMQHERLAGFCILTNLPYN